MGRCRAVSDFLTVFPDFYSDFLAIYSAIPDFPPTFPVFIPVIPALPPVIPAKAGIHSAQTPLGMSRERGRLARRAALARGAPSP